MKKSLGIMSLMSTGKLTMPTKEELEREFGSPYRKPNTNIIYCGTEFAKKLKKILKKINNGKF